MGIEPKTVLLFVHCATAFQFLYLLYLKIKKNINYISAVLYSKSGSNKNYKLQALVSCYQENVSLELGITWLRFLSVLDITVEFLARITCFAEICKDHKNVDSMELIPLNIIIRRGAGAQSVTVKSTGCGFDPHSRQ